MVKRRVMQSARTLVQLLCAVFVIGIWKPASAQSPIDIVTENYPPYEMQETVNGLRGFDYEVATEAFTRMGYVPEIRFLPWKRALKEAESGTTAGVLTCAQNEERARYLLFSDPISSFTDGLFMRRGHSGPRIREIHDVVGQPVASMAGYESLGVLNDIGADPIEVPNTLDGLNMLQARRFDYLHGGREMTEFMIRKHGFAGAFEFISLDREPFHFCFSKAYPGVEALLADFNAVLAEMRRDGTYRAIHAKYR